MIIKSGSLIVSIVSDMICEAYYMYFKFHSAENENSQY